MPEKTYTIQELSAESGVSRRNIYFYTQQGILPPPQGAGLAARYGEHHLLRLQAIPALRSQGLRLDDIRARLSNADLDELRRLAKPAPQFAHAIFNHVAAFPVPRSFAMPQPDIFRHYTLPSGLTLIVPTQLSPENRDKVERLLKIATDLFREGTPSHPEQNPTTPDRS